MKFDDSDWLKYESIRQWKKQLRKGSIDGLLKDSTWDNAIMVTAKFTKFSGKTPDQLIEMARTDDEFAEDLCDEFYAECQNTVGTYSSWIYAYGHLRSFFSHNKIKTRGWKIPQQPETGVSESDDKFPLFVPDSENVTLLLNKEMLHPFLKHLSLRDEAVYVSLLSSGIDVGVLLSKKLSWIRDQSKHDRLFVKGTRPKTGEKFMTFISKEATKMIRNYINMHRRDADDDSPIFVLNKSEVKKVTTRYQKNLPNNHIHKDIALSVDTFSKTCRRIQTKLDIKTSKQAHSPLRPKRARKGFRSGCQIAGLDQTLVQMFMGHKGEMVKLYQGCSREEWEMYYIRVEPHLTVYADSPSAKKDQEIASLTKRMNAIESVFSGMTDVLPDTINVKNY